METIFNFYKYNNKLAAGGQPTAEQIKEMKEKGVEVVISLSPVSTRNYLPIEAQLVEELGMQFIHFPVDCSNLTEQHFTTFKGILKGADKKNTFVHCGGNIKSSNLIHMYRVIEQGLNEEQSLAELKTVQQPEPKWITYFKQFGMAGLS